jgi:hypothetical protein
MDLAAARRARLARVLARAGVPAAVPVLMALSDSNDVWRIGPVVLRICWRGDRDRFAREAAVTAVLPAGVPYPEVLDTGREDDLAWQVTRLAGGVPLATAWPALPLAQRRAAIHQVGAALRVLNAHRFPARVIAALAAPRPDGDVSAAALIGADLNPLPHQRALRLAALVRDLRYADTALIDDAMARLRDLAPIDPLDDAAATAGGTAFGRLAAVGCVHGDAHPANVLWQDGRVTALLDFEWVRLGPPDLEIEPYLRWHYRATTNKAETPAILGWLAESHPAAFSPPRLTSRLWLYQLAFTLRHILIEPPDRPARELPADHPVRILGQLIAGPGYLSQLLPETGRQ